MNIAVIGSGISGLAAAWCLQQHHQVQLFEADARIGGHTHTVDVELDGRHYAIDTGFIVCNDRNYPNFLALLSALGVPRQPAPMSFAVSLDDGAWEWHGSDRPSQCFAQPGNLFKPQHWRLLIDIVRLNRRCQQLLASGRLPEHSLGEFLAQCGYHPWLAERYLLPMAGLIWSCSPQQAAEYPADEFMRFFESHGLFSLSGKPQWYAIEGGSRNYLQALCAQLQQAPRTSAAVRQLRRTTAGVDIEVDGQWLRFDAVVSAVHADEALAMLGDGNDAEQRMLAGMPYTESEVVLHSDPQLMPRRKAAWGAWNYLARSDRRDSAICGTYWMNRLQGLPETAQPWLVTLNPMRAPQPALTHFHTRYRHPFYSAASRQTHQLLPRLQGRGGLWWCGAWTGYGFHEDGLKSALRVVKQLDARCLPAWASALDAASDEGAPQPRPVAAPLLDA